MKKALALMLLFVLGILLFATGVQEATEPEQERVYTFEWLGGHSGAPLSENPRVELWLEEKLGVEFNFWYIERSQWNEILNLRFAAGEIPDVLRVAATSLPTSDAAEIAKYVKQDIIMPVEIDTIKAHAPGIYQMLIDFYPNAFQSCSVGGKNYGLPRTNLNGSYNYAPIWRLDWLQNVGIAEIPGTIAEYEDAFYKFRHNDPDGNGIKDTYGISNMGFLPIYGAFGALPDRWIEKDGKLVFGAVVPAMKDALTLMADWYAKEIIDPEFITGENHGGYWALSHDFINGKIGYSSPGAFYHINPPLYEGDAGGKMWRTFNEAIGGDRENPIAETDGIFGIGYNPIGPDGHQGGEYWGAGGTEILGFGSHLRDDLPKLHKALEVVDQLASDWDNFFMARLGMEWGSDEYFVNDAGAFKLNEEKYPANPDRVEGSGNAWVPIETPQFDKRINPARYVWGDSKPMFHTGGYEKVLKITPASAGMYWSEMEAFRELTYIQIIAGEKPVDYFDEFVEEWYAMGGKQITAEANEWWASR